MRTIIFNLRSVMKFLTIDGGEDHIMKGYTTKLKKPKADFPALYFANLILQLSC